MNCTPEQLIKELSMEDITDEVMWVSPEAAKAAVGEGIVLEAVGMVPWKVEGDCTPVFALVDGNISFGDHLFTRERGTLAGFETEFLLLHNQRIYRGSYEAGNPIFWREVGDKYDMKEDFNLMAYILRNEREE